MEAILTQWLNKFLSILSSPNAERVLKTELSEEWVNEHRSQFASYINIAAAAATAILAVLDFAVFGSSALRSYTIYRGLTLLLLVPPYVVYHKVRPRVTSPSAGVDSALMLYPALFLNALYAYFLFKASIPDHPIVLVGNAMVIFVCYMFIYRFSREQTILTITALLGLAVTAGARPELRSDCGQIAVAHLASLVLIIAFRREFTARVLSKYLSFRSLWPAKVARIVAVSRGGEDAVFASFGPRERYAVCVCLDWRGYQKIAESLTPKEISELFASFYEFAFQTLDHCVPTGTYHADWNADELFATFYSDANDKAEVLRVAMSFVRIMSREASDHVRHATGFDLVFDFGMSAGVGLLGLIGPRQRLKTTIVADFAGHAKRFETAAKERREQHPGLSKAPILMVDQHLSNEIQQLGLMAAMTKETVVVQTKDVRGVVCVAWQLDKAVDARRRSDVDEAQTSVVVARSVA